MARVFLWFIAIWCLGLGGGTARSEDKVEAAVRVYRETRQEQTDQLKAAFSRRQKEAEKSGDLKRVQELLDEQNQFIMSGELPSSKAMKSSVEKYRKTMDGAQEKVRKILEAEIKAETREGNLEKAQALREQQQNLDKLLSGNADPVTPLPDRTDSTDGGGQDLHSIYSRLPERVRVLPIAFVPADQQPPSDIQTAEYLRHLLWAQKRFGELLNGESFEFANDPPEMKVVAGRRPLAFYRDAPEGGAPEVVAEILNSLKLNRFENPYSFAILLMNAVDRFPVGGGRPINGGTNGGGGMFYIGSGELQQNAHFQCTLQHELGHSFGLAHVDAYGYDMNSNMSIMSYNPRHHNQGFLPSPTPGILNPEDRRVLALNDRMFSQTGFDIRKNVPKDYKLFRYLVPLGPMQLPGHPSFYPAVAANVKSFGGSQPENCLYGYIRPSEGPGVTYDGNNMWHTEHNMKVPEAIMEITFPNPVEIDGLGIHTQHSRLDHEATHVRLIALDAAKPVEVVNEDLTSIDAEVSVPVTRSQRWKLALTPGKSRTIVVRGIRFLKGGREILPRMVPYGNLDLIP